MGNDVSSSSSYNNFFEDSIILWENNKKTIWSGGSDINISIFNAKNINNTIKNIDSKNYW